MRKTGNPAIKKYFLTVALFFSFSVVLYLGQIFVTKQSEALLKQTANGVLKSWSNTAPEVGNRIKLTTKGLSYTWTFDTISKGNKTGLVFITAITGNSGPYTGIFIYSPQNGVKFCGLAGITGSNSNPDKYGITERILNARMNKLGLIANEYGASK